MQQITIQLGLHVYRTPRLLDNGKQISWPPFSEEKNNFVTITSKSSLHSNFRFCQMALWSGILPTLQSATCKALWGITKFSEDALATVDHALQQVVRPGAVVSTVINSTLFKNVGTGAASAILNEIIPANHGIQVDNGQFTHMFRNPTVPPHSHTKVGNGTVIKAILNETEMGKSGNGGPNSTAFHGTDKMGSQINSSTSSHENFVLPVTDSSTDTSTVRNQNQPGLLPSIIKPLINRTTLFPSPGLFPRPLVG